MGTRGSASFARHRFTSDRSAKHRFAAHLHVRSGYSYGQGVAYPRELVARAASMGYETLALTDRDGLYGIPRFLLACEEYGLSPIVGAEVTVEAYGERGHVVLLCESPAGYAALSGLVTRYRLIPGPDGEHPAARARRFPACPVELLLEGAPVAAPGSGAGLVCLTGSIPDGLLPRLVARGKWTGAKELLSSLSEAFGKGNVYAELTDDRTRYCRTRIGRIHGLAGECGVPALCAHEVTYLMPEDHRISETMWAAYNTTALPGPGHRPTDGLYLKDPGKMRRTFQATPTRSATPGRWPAGAQGL